MWPTFLHHITLHFPIVLTLVIAGIGVWSLRQRVAQFKTFVRWVGWACFAITTVAVVSGIIAAPGPFGGGGSPGLADHRNLGLTAWAVMGASAWSYEVGIRAASRDWRTFGVCVWVVAVFATLGAAHWGGTELHHDEVPWIEHTDQPDSANNVESESSRGGS